ncbi:hypothetical protein BVD23_03600 [Salmonella enterica]|nr:hypothetical protein [Salmonella enterica]EBI7616343.1 hypothetical protein [Salmonella enterica]EBI8098006.1 hypothetical protein [Salmonella enterica]EBK3005263.1 hypothetical protein [Salmonella enterica]EBK9149906.1 hypothetical protein [Salmonella enterica]
MSPTSYQAAPPRVRLSAAHFKSHVRWLSSFTSVLYLCKFRRIHCVAAFLCFELLCRNLLLLKF